MTRQRYKRKRKCDWPVHCHSSGYNIHVTMHSAAEAVIKGSLNEKNLTSHLKIYSFMRAEFLMSKYGL